VEGNGGLNIYNTLKSAPYSKGLISITIMLSDYYTEDISDVEKVMPKPCFE